MTFETFDQSDEETWPDQKKDNDKDKDKDKDKDNDKDKDILRTPPKILTKTNTFWEHLLRAILETCDIWDTDYNSDNWEPEFMTIFVTWQLIVTLDSIRNSCDVFINSYDWKMVWKTLQESRMLSIVTLDCQVTKIVMHSGSQL